MKKETFTAGHGPTVLRYGETYKFDKKDIAILKCLYIDGRMSLIDMSKQVGLSRDAIRNRIENMMKAEVILRFKPILNPPRMGFQIINYVFISLHNLGPKSEDEFVKWMQNNKNITYISSLVGKWDYIIDVITRTPEETSKLLKDMRQKFSDIIKDFEIYGVMEEHKYEEFVGLLE